MIPIGRKRLGALVVLASIASPATADGPGDRVSPVVTAPVVKQEEVRQERTFLGAVEPSRKSVVASEFAGLVIERAVSAGDRVEAGQPLATLRAKLPKLLAIDVVAARAQLEQQEHALAELENGARTEEIEQVRALLGQAQADLELRQWKHESAKRLFAKRTISEDELTEERLALRASEEAHKRAEAALNLVLAGPRKERIARAAAVVAQQQGVVDRLVEESKDYVVTAPFTGYVTVEHTEAGQWIETGDPIVELVALDEVDVVVAVLEDYLTGLDRGLAVQVSIDALPLAQRTRKGTIHRIIPSGDARARTFPVEIRVKNALHGTEPLLKGGMFARAKITVVEREGAFAVPKDALVLGGPTPMVYVVDPQSSTVRPVPVDVGGGSKGLVQVQGALTEGDRVVVRGNEGLRPGQKVQDRGGP